VLKATLIAALCGILSGRFLRNLWWAAFLVAALIVGGTGYEAIRHPAGLDRDARNFGILDATGTTAIVIGEWLAG
jgi:hypothetical protein